jgi:hypothetical protein
MIYHIQTYCTYGYWSEELAPSSDRPIIVACDRCGKIRITRKPDYRTLCKSCAMKKQWENPLKRKNQSEKISKRFEDPKERKKNSEANKKSIKVKENAERQRGGNDIVRHHVAYNVTDLHGDDHVVLITRSFHTKIHKPKGISISERGYSLID